MDFVILRVKGTEKTVLAKPQVITLVGQEAKITHHGDDGNKLELTVVPTLQ